MFTDLETEAIKLSALINASEDWSDEYKKDPESFKNLLKNDAKWTVAMLRFFKQVGSENEKFINWYDYSRQVNADYNVDMIIDETVMGYYDDEFIKISLEYVVGIATAGAQSGENIYQIYLGLDSTDALMQKLGTDRVASLVGKKLMPDGSIITNPRAEYNVTKTMRNDIAQSIKTSLNLGETVQQAQARVDKVIKNPKRSEKIARTESVNTYQAGLDEFGLQAGAAGKAWLSVGATDICGVFAAKGPVPFGYEYQTPMGRKIKGPTAHVGCRCGRRLIFQEEWDKLQK